MRWKAEPAVRRTGAIDRFWGGVARNEYRSGAQVLAKGRRTKATGFQLSLNGGLEQNLGLG